MRSHVAPMVLLACAVPLAAAPMDFALRIGAAQGQGDLRNLVGSRIAREFGVSAGIQLGAGLTIRPTLEYQGFPVLADGYTYHSARYNDVGNENARMSGWSSGVEAHYLSPRTAVPVYFLVGAYLKMWQERSYGSFTTSDIYNGTRTYSVDDTTTKNEPALALGLGCKLTRLVALETRMTFASYRKQAYNTLHLGVVIRM